MIKSFKLVVFFFAGILFLNASEGNEKLKAHAYKRVDLGTVPSTIVPYLPEGLGPIEITWKTLSDVTYKDIYVKELDAYYWKPTFGASVKAVAGKEVFITGYLIPVDYDAGFYVVSKYPYANCFFCGGGGPESVVDLRFVGKHRNYKTDERLTFKGKLKLNADDVYQMNYILEGAVEFTP